VRRREFITLFGGVALTWSVGARAQRAERKLVGIVTGFGEEEVQLFLPSFRKRLGELGWAEDRNIRIDVHAAGGDYQRLIAEAGAFIGSRPDVVLAVGTPGLTAVRQHSRTVPVIFTLVADPVEQGLIESLARPGGHATGFTNFDFSIGGKWLELLRDLEPRLTRVALIANPNNPNFTRFSQCIEDAGRSVGVDVATVTVRNAAEIEAAIKSFAQKPLGGLIILPDSLAVIHRNRIAGLAASHRLPAIYPFRIFPMNGGLISYGLDFPELYQQAAVYVDRVLRGTKPAELPVQAPTKFELVINLKTAKALGLTIPPSLLARADEVIE
jgi:putative ABC transport system substrate-binding protein